MTSNLVAFVARSQSINAYVGGQPITDFHGKSQLKHLTSVIQKTPKKIARDLGTKGNLTMYQVKKMFTDAIVLYDNKTNKAVAYAILDSLEYRPKYKTLNTLYVAKSYRGRKLASILHLGAAHVYPKLMSDTTMAMGALNAFRSLEKHGYKIKMFDTKNRTTVPFKWGSDGIPVVDGTSIEDSERYALYV